ncbi:hypothetical protein GQ53DRAFT_821367 [Thozetella sp. PMI_491]|nr:hypothetical protein GQ53DRAFT_821367 [Thozetella sp. PMI_491]
MKFFSIPSVFGLLTSVLATPAALIEKRQYDSEVSTLSGLYSSILPYTGTINTTVLGLPVDVDEASRDAAASTVNDAVTQITTLVSDAASSITSSAKARVRPHQADAVTVVDLLGLILTELSGALNNVIAVLGLVTA